MALEMKMAYRRPLDPEAVIKPFATMTVEMLPSDNEESNAEIPKTVASLQMVVEGELAYGDVRIEGDESVTLGSITVENGDGLWELAVRLLRQMYDFEVQRNRNIEDTNISAMASDAE